MPDQKYYWDQWFRRKKVTLHKGVDYHCGQGTIMQQIRNAASRRGVPVKVQEGDGCVTITVTANKKEREQCPLL